MSHAPCKPLLPAIKTSGHVCALSQEEPCSATDATEQSIMGHNAGPQGMPSTPPANQRAWRTCRQLKDGAWTTPTCSHRHGERNAGMRDSLADEAIAPHATLPAVYRGVHGPFVPAGWHAKRRRRGDRRSLL